MPQNFHPNSPSYQDLLIWRKHSLAGFIALGPQAIRSVGDTHLVTYSTALTYVDTDWTNWSEDGHIIKQTCSDNGYPLDFMSINSYPLPGPGNELRGVGWAVKYMQWQTELPVMVTETGATLYDIGGNEDLQAVVIQNAILEFYTTGVIGVHIFTWNDKVKRNFSMTHNQ